MFIYQLTHFTYHEVISAFNIEKQKVPVTYAHKLSHHFSVGTTCYGISKYTYDDVWFTPLNLRYF